MENEIMLVNERYHMLEEVSDDIVLDYDVKKQQFEIPECYLKFAEDKSVKYAGIEELYGAIHPDDRERFQKIFETALQREMKGTAEYRLRQGGKNLENMLISEPVIRVSQIMMERSATS